MIHFFWILFFHPQFPFFYALIYMIYPFSRTFLKSFVQFEFFMNLHPLLSKSFSIENSWKSLLALWSFHDIKIELAWRIFSNSMKEKKTRHTKKFFSLQTQRMTQYTHKMLSQKLNDSLCIFTTARVLLMFISTINTRMEKRHVNDL